MSIPIHYGSLKLIVSIGKVVQNAKIERYQLKVLGMFNKAVLCILKACVWGALSVVCVGCAKTGINKTIKKECMAEGMTFADTPTSQEREMLKIQSAKLREQLKNDEIQVNQASDTFKATKKFLKGSQ
ncbi:MAG: hypothetical protein J0G29_04835 [Alphaproteobacteria bacterium]|nr:hypothetical protein [Alphaproteobacteria bacterium]OJV46618.1 MAG: hypothetical protein BGO28_04615 [Alphaproteobacteria bacterium 43-37]